MGDSNRSNGAPDLQCSIPCGSDLHFDVVDFESLSDSVVADWHDIRSQSDCYRSPFFAHGFIQAVAKRLPGVQVAFARASGKTIALLPFRLRGDGHTIPPGSGINDAHGLIAKLNKDLDVCLFLKACGLKSFAFHAAPPKSPGILDYEIGRTRAFLADLSVDPRGYCHYLRSRNRTIQKQSQKTRKLAREVGPLRFEFDCRDPEMVRRLLDLKREQYRRTYTFDIFSVPWIEGLIHDLHTRLTSGACEEDADLGNPRGVLSVLFAGSTPVALHYGLLEANRLHYWFPVYDMHYHFASPGTQLFLDVVVEAERRGIQEIDLGYGEQAYKFKLTNQITEMSFGLVDSNRLRRALFRTHSALKSRTKKLKIRQQLKPLARCILPQLGKRNYTG